MANFKRGKCRRNCPKAIRGSQTSWRARHGFRPARVLPFHEAHPGCSVMSAEWDAHHELMWAQQGKHYVSMMGSYPAWWDREFHTRPHRAATKRLERKIITGADPDDIVWPLRRKPHRYYW